MRNKKYLLLIAIALAIKFLLFGFTSFCAPQGKFLNDSFRYIETGKMLASGDLFATQAQDGAVHYEFIRTPGYPFILAVLHGWMKIPLEGVIFLQVILSILVAAVTYKIAIRINQKIGFLSAVIVLYDPPVTIFSLTLLTEVLFLFLIAVFLFFFAQYLGKRKVQDVIISALVLALATYVRPITYYLGIAMTFFIVYANLRYSNKKAVFHAIIFFIAVYSVLGIWQIRNHIRFGHYTFSGIEQQDLKSFGLFKSYAKDKASLPQGTTPFSYYINTTFRCLSSLMTSPGTLKYFHYRVLTVPGKILGYPWMGFWILGFIIGIINIKRNIYYQCCLLIIMYFIFTSIGGIGLLVSERFRVPMVPCIAIISAQGWVTWFQWFKIRTRRNVVHKGSTVV